MAKRRPESFKLKPHHTWKAPDGYRIFVADRGAVRFNFPEDWAFVMTPDAPHMYDREPPNDNCRLACSYLRIPDMDWSGLPLTELIRAAIIGDPRGLTYVKEAVLSQRADVEIGWAEFRFTDRNEYREALTRLCFARGNGIQAFLTFDFWPEDAERLQPVWEEALRSLELGHWVEDPTVGKSVS
jgi:hypothetical protein